MHRKMNFILDSMIELGSVVDFIRDSLDEQAIKNGGITMRGLHIYTGKGFSL